MRNTICLFTVALFTVAATANAQPDSLWSRTYGGDAFDDCYSIIKTDDGGYVLVGRTSSFGVGVHDMCMLKTDEDGDSLWYRTFGGEELDGGTSVIQTEDGSYILAGITESFGNGLFDMWLVKTDEDGDSLWSRTFGGRNDDLCNSIIQTEDGGFALAGFTSSFGAGNNRMWLVKTNADGDSLWSRTFGGADWSEYSTIIQTADGGYILAGKTGSFYNKDMLLLKTDEDGDLLWSRTFGGDSTDYCYAMIQTDDGGYALAGYTESFGSGSHDMWLVKTDEDGDSLWSRTFGGEDSEVCRSVIQTSEGGYVLTGSTKSFSVGRKDMWLLRTNAEGDSLWSLSFGGRRTDDCKSLVQTANGSYLLAGFTASFGDEVSDFWLVKTGPDPVSVESEPYNAHPSTFILQPAFPNPFNSTTNISFDIPHNSEVSISIYDLSGRSVATLFDNSLNTGTHNLTWDAKDYPAGVYLCRMKAGEFAMTEKLLLVK